MTVPGSVLYWNKKEKQDRTQAAVQQEGDGMKVRCSGCGAVVDYGANRGLCP